MHALHGKSWNAENSLHKRLGKEYFENMKTLYELDQKQYLTKKEKDLQYSLSSGEAHLKDELVGRTLENQNGGTQFEELNNGSMFGSPVKETRQQGMMKTYRAYSARPFKNIKGQHANPNNPYANDGAYNPYPVMTTAGYQGYPEDAWNKGCATPARGIWSTGTSQMGIDPYVPPGMPATKRNLMIIEANERDGFPQPAHLEAEAAAWRAAREKAETVNETEAAEWRAARE